ncbi:MAG TPA: phosphodiester glycosidase family protein [Candidatus Limnocylindrales bacterium]|nr:phosphodiester glycosidase family protein [Candidatus Limnocylindrales bacterium]
MTARTLAARTAAICLVVATLLLSTPAAALGAPADAPAASPAAALCTKSDGPGIAPPARVPSGIPGYHAAWYGQSGYPTLCPGDRSTAIVAYYNSGTAGWIRGKMGEAAYLGTWETEPGQDRPSPLGGDGTNGSPQTGWPRYNRIATQPSDWVGPNQIAWFQFTIQAPMDPGYYRLYLRPLIEGTTWMEDFGVFWLITVLNPDGTRPPVSGATSGTGYSVVNVATAAGTFSTRLIKERLAQVRVRTVTANTSDCFSSCPAKPLAQYATENGAYAAIHGSYFCPPDYAPCASKVNTYDYAVYNSNLGSWINTRHLANPMNALATFNGSTPAFYRRVSTYGRGPVTAGISNFPLLMSNGVVLDVSADIDSNQRLRGTRAAIGVDATFVYLAIVSGASVPETALVMQALGARDVMNLDGGGSAAMWISGSYVLGPGRLLPNAILLMKP